MLLCQHKTGPAAGEGSRDHQHSSQTSRQETAETRQRQSADDAKTSRGVRTIAAQGQGLTCINIKVREFHCVHVRSSSVHIRESYDKCCNSYKHVETRVLDLKPVLWNQQHRRMTVGSHVFCQGRDEGAGNVHSGATPPWLQADDNESQQSDVIGPTRQDYQLHCNITTHMSAF